MIISPHRHVTPRLTRLADITPIPTHWLWPPYLPLLHLSLLTGPPGVGKSLLTLKIAAAVSTGRIPHWPATRPAPHPPRSVILIAGEDIAQMQLRPRLEQLNADLDRIHMLHVENEAGRRSEYCLERHTGALRAAMKDLQEQGSPAALVIIDPLSHFLDGPENGNHAGVRRLLSPLIAAAHNHCACVLAVTHQSKRPRKGRGRRGEHGHDQGDQGDQADQGSRVAGSTAYSAAARSILQVTRDPRNAQPGARLLHCIKSNYAAVPPALPFHIDDAGRVIFDHAEEPSGAGGDSRGGGTSGGSGGGGTSGGVIPRRVSALQHAAAWLMNELTRTQDAAQLIRRAAVAGIPEITLRRAKEQLGIRSERHHPRNAWKWVRPRSTTEITESTEQEQHVESIT